MTVKCFGLGGPVSPSLAPKADSRDRPVVTYCNMHQRGESRGERAAVLLREQGYQAQTIDGGYPAWKEASLPVVEASQE